MAFTPIQVTMLVHLTNFPEWAIPMTKIVPVFSVGDAWDQSKLTYGGRLRYWWKKIDDNIYDIYVELNGTVNHVGLDSFTVPLFVDVDLVIVNENIYEEVDTDKS